MWRQLILFIVLARASKSWAQDCTIPSGPQFSRASFRPYHGRSDSGKTRYDAGEPLRVGMWIRVVCNKDRHGDAVYEASTHWCIAGRWDPQLPMCQENMRCRAPPSVSNAKASERINPYITFPHQTVVQYKCNAGFDMRGTMPHVTCVDGEWTSPEVACVAMQTESTEKKQNTDADASKTVRHQSTTVRTVPVCTEPEIQHGKFVKDVTSGLYDVICDVGYRAISSERVRCVGGQWSAPIPQCGIQFRQPRTTVRTLALCTEPAIQHGKFVKDVTSIYYDVICDVGYKATSSERVLCVGGRWSARIPDCQIQRCPHLSDNFTLYKSGPSSSYPGPESALSTGRDSGLDLTHGAAVKILCGNDGFPTFGIERAWCHEGQWLPKIPICGKYCARPASVDLKDDRTRMPVPELVMSGVKVRQTCEDGRTRTNICHDGRWKYGFVRCP